MAKRKAAGSRTRRSARKSSGAGRKRTPVRKAAGRKAGARKAIRRKARRPVKPVRTRVAKKAVAARKLAARKAAARKPAARKPAARKAAPRKTAGSKSAPPSARNVARATRPNLAGRARTVVSRKAPVLSRKAPALDRARRTVQDDDIVPTPPSSLDLDRTASSARSGRRELSRRLDEHTETGPALTAGDVDADWESAYSVGDEAPGGDNPTPDQDVVDDIGKAVGVQYEDSEELKGEAKISKRDKHRWELDPASAEDYEER